MFLGEDNSVKLGDFGLSKIMQSHDFASTYVGTPFYMSPEICAAERYTLKSDIWSLGCIIYELCSREPPFNAKSHLQLVQRIRAGVVSQIPNVYSAELMNVIRSCLRVNPDERPDTAALLNLPMIKLMRKEKEVVELARILKGKEDMVVRRLAEADSRIKKLDADKLSARQEIESVVRREWEVRARLEIDRQVAIEMEALQAKFEAEVNDRVHAEVKRLGTANEPEGKQFDSSTSRDDFQSSSVSTHAESTFTSTDLTSVADLTDYSMDSPEALKALKKSARTPFGRAQTMFAGAVGTPLDVEMAEPSPISIAGLSLSPRRQGGAKVPAASRNIFANAQPRMSALISSDTEDEDDMPLLPSPTRAKSSKNPFKPVRPGLVSQRTAPVHKLGSQPNLFAGPKNTSAPMLPSMSSQPDLRLQPSTGASREGSSSPKRRLSKIPSSSNLTAVDPGTSPTRKSSLTRRTPSSNNSSDSDLNKVAIKNNMARNVYQPARGRTLVELQQARAGGRQITGDESDSNGAGSPKGRRFAERMAMRQDAPVWDPNELGDDMPSPFKKAPSRPLRS